MTQKVSPTTTFADGLRALADLYDANPETFDAHYPHVNLNLFSNSAEALTSLARQIGGRWDKGSVGSFFTLTKDLGGSVTLELNVSHANACERVQVGTVVVEVPDPELVAQVPKVTREEPQYEYRCPPSLLAASFAKQETA